MKEKLYTIPVSEAFAQECECPLCAMRRSLENASVEFTLGPSYMEDDVRGETTKAGFCTKHVKELYTQQNRLGLALILQSYTERTTAEMERLAKSHKPQSGGLFSKKEQDSPLLSYIEQKEKNCYICNRVNSVFERYIATVFYLYEKEDFVNTLKKSRGFCMSHYGLLLKRAPEFLSGKNLEEFTKMLHTLYFENIKRVNDDLAWFIKKFDYRFAEEPWNNAKDALPRTITKTNSEIMKN